MLTMREICEKATPIARKYNLLQLDVFGSYADGTATDASDVDFLARFPKTPSIFKVCGLQTELQTTLGLDVDVVTLPIPAPSRLRIERSVPVL